MAGMREHSLIWNPRQVCIAGRENIDGRFAAQTAAHDRMMQTGIRREANHASAVSSLHLLPHSREFLLDVRRRRMRQALRFLLTLSFRDVNFHLALVAEEELPLGERLGVRRFDRAHRWRLQG